MNERFEIYPLGGDGFLRRHFMLLDSAEWDRNPDDPFAAYVGLYGRRRDAVRAQRRILLRETAG